MNKYDKLFKSYDFGFFGSGAHKITFDQMVNLKKEDKAFILEVRTKEENEIINFSFARNIPINELLKRLNELLKNKTIVLFCSSATRATMAFPYLIANGFENTKIILDNIGDIASEFKPCFVKKNLGVFTK